MQKAAKSKGSVSSSLKTSTRHRVPFRVLVQRWKEGLAHPVPSTPATPQQPFTPSLTATEFSNTFSGTEMRKGTRRKIFVFVKERITDRNGEENAIEEVVAECEENAFSHSNSIQQYARRVSALLLRIDAIIKEEYKNYQLVIGLKEGLEQLADLIELISKWRSVWQRRPKVLWSKWEKDTDSEYQQMIAFHQQAKELVLSCLEDKQTVDPDQINPIQEMKEKIHTWMAQFASGPPEGVDTERPGQRKRPRPNPSSINNPDATSSNLNYNNHNTHNAHNTPYYNYNTDACRSFREPAWIPNHYIPEPQMPSSYPYFPFASYAPSPTPFYPYAQYYYQPMEGCAGIFPTTTTPVPIDLEERNEKVREKETEGEGTSSDHRRLPGIDAVLATLTQQPSYIIPLSSKVEEEEEGIRTRRVRSSPTVSKRQSLGISKVDQEKEDEEAALLMSLVGGALEKAKAATTTTTTTLTNTARKRKRTQEHQQHNRRNNHDTTPQTSAIPNKREWIKRN